MSRILVVDDETVIAMELEKMLSDLGHDVIGRASSGEDAVELARSFKPDIILMDISMPGEMDGIDAAGMIKQELSIPVIFLTAYALDDLIQRAKRVEPLGYILKPFQEEQIRAAVDVAVYKSHMERQLRESEAKYRRIVYTAREGIYVVDTETRIEFVNKQLADMLGYSVGEMMGRNLVDFMNDISPVDIYEDGQLGKGNIEAKHDFRLRRKDGSVLWAMVSSSTIYDENGGLIGGLGMVSDITQRKMAERALRKKNEELRNFVDTVSHDLKNPIFSIRGFSTLLLRNFEKSLGEKGRGYLQLIDESARQMDNLVTDLLTFSEIGHVVPNRKSVVSHEIIEKAISSLQGKLTEKGVELIVAKSFPIIYCDAERIYQVFENLLANAIKFAGDGKVPRIKVGYEDIPGYHHFYVRDNGRGVEPKHHRKIFEMFYRIKDENKKDGTGLGLAIVDKIISQHGGKAWIESKKGEGATFFFTLPK